MEHTTPTKPTLFITGVAGNFGHVFLQKAPTSELFQRFHVRAGTSNPNKLTQLRTSYPEIEWVLCNLEKQDEVESALKGVDTLFLIPGGVQNRSEIGVECVKTAKKMGVRKVLLFSVVGAEENSIMFFREMRAIEEAVEKSGLLWNHLRTLWFQQNIFGWKDPIKNGKFPIAMGRGRCPWMNLADAADAALVLLLKEDKQLEKGIWNITGPESLSGEDVANILSSSLGKAVEYVDLSPEEQLRVSLKMGWPEWQARGSQELLQWFADGRGEKVYPDFKTLTGKEGTRFEDWFGTVKGMFE